MSHSNEEGICTEDICKTIYSLFSQILKLKTILENSDYKESQERYISKQSVKKELYKQTMKLTDDQFRELSNNILSSTRRDIDIVANQLSEFGENCWDCNFSMCYRCSSKLQSYTCTLLEIINKN